MPEWWRSADELIPEMRPDDEVWYFESLPLTWQYMFGRAGYALVRHGHTVSYVVTRLN